MLAELSVGELSIIGQLTDASNVAVLVEVGGRWAMYKPIRGERPLWDFPAGTLAGRELAAYVIARATGYAVVPPTVLRDGPLGVGTVQLWIGHPSAVPGTNAPVTLVPARQVPSGWLHVVDGQLGDGREVSVVHEDRDDVRDMAVLDAVINNADRKGSHLVRDSAGRLWGFDHGLTCNAEPKLRTVLWGWAGKPLRDSDLAVLARLDGALADPSQELARTLAELLPEDDVLGLRRRVRLLSKHGVHPTPSRSWPSIPWPAF